MRALDKWAVGTNGVVEDYIPYGSAKEKLIENIGECCSYCEIPGKFVNLEVEHVKDKDTYEELKTKWTNFLLACKNCNTTKGRKENNPNTHILPHIHNSYQVYNYSQGGLISISTDLTKQDQAKALNTMELVGLHRRPGIAGYSDADKRWLYRKKAHDLAERYKIKLQEGTADLEVICDMAIREGFWSVWMNVFKDRVEVQDALIAAFNGTFPQCRTTNINRL